MRARISGFFLIVAFGIAIFPNGICPGCVGPQCLFKDASHPSSCACCASLPDAKSRGPGQVNSTPARCCFLLPLFVGQSTVSTPLIDTADSVPDLTPYTLVCEKSVQLADDAGVQLSKHPDRDLYIAIHALLI